MKVLIAVAAAAPKKVKSAKLDPKVNATMKRMMTNALKAAGFKTGDNSHEGSVSPRPGILVHVYDDIGFGYNHRVPMALRGKDRKPPTFYRVFFGIGVNGETVSHTSDGPIGRDKLHYTYERHFDHVPTPDELKSVNAELKTHVKEGRKVYLDLIKKYTPTK